MEWGQVQLFLIIIAVNSTELKKLIQFLTHYIITQSTMSSTDEFPFNENIINTLMMMMQNENFRPHHLEDYEIFTKEVMKQFQPDFVLPPYEKGRMLRHFDDDFKTDDLTDYELLQEYFEIIHYQYLDFIEEMMGENDSDEDEDD